MPSSSSSSSSSPLQLLLLLLALAPYTCALRSWMASFSSLTVVDAAGPTSSATVLDVLPLQAVAGRTTKSSMAGWLLLLGGSVVGVEKQRVSDDDAAERGKFEHKCLGHGITAALAACVGQEELVDACVAVYGV